MLLLFPTVKVEISSSKRPDTYIKHLSQETINMQIFLPIIINNGLHQYQL